MKQVILFADNDPETCEVFGKALTDQGYDVRFATNPGEALTKLMSGGIDLAVLDMRLEDDEPTDISGLTLANNLSFRHIPKIILTGYQPSPEFFRKIRELSADELPAAVTWVGKEEGPNKLLELIPRVIAHWMNLQKTQILTSNIARRLEEDQAAIRRQAAQNYTRATFSSYVGFGLIIASIILAFFEGAIEISKVVAVSGVITEVLGYLFFRRLDVANKRMDKYHQEILQTHGLELLLATCEPLPAEKQIAVSERIIQAATESWFLKSSAKD